MPIQTRYLLHQDGPALWPDHKPLSEVLELKATTPPAIFSGTYQGLPTPPEGSTFHREWWAGKNRFDINDSRMKNLVIARWISWDTALKDDEENAFSAAVVGELLADYRLAIREVWRGRPIFPNLIDEIERIARKYRPDEKLRQIILEDKASGTSAFQTLSISADNWLAPLLFAFLPSGDKQTRAEQAAVWCSNGSVLLPYPSEDAPWLIDFEDEIFDFPGSTFKDQVDAFSQLILFTENLLAEGYHAREGRFFQESNR